MKTMNTSSTLRTLPKLLALLVALGCTLPLVHAKVGEQENWYLAKEISTEITGYTPDSWGQYYSFDVHTSQTTGEEIITVIFQGISGETDIPVTIKTFSLEGELFSSNTLLTELPENRAYDIEIDTDGKIYGVNYSFIFCIEEDEVIWTKDFGNERPYFRSLAMGPDGKLYAALENKKKIYVFDKEGNKLSEIGGPGEAPGQFAENVRGVDFLPNGNLITSTYNRLHVFKTDGTFIKRTNNPDVWDYTRVTVSATGQILAWGKLFDQDLNALKSPENDGDYYLNFANSYQNNFAKWTSSGDIVTTAWINNQRPLQIWKRAYRTKGLPTPNLIPQPIVRSVAQRPGTNILDIDFEIIDGDDATATAGLIAAVDGNFNDLSELIIPTAFDEGTENKVGQPIATNQLHRVSWYVKGDWNELSGNLKVGVICRDARRTKPVDLHFLELPLEEGTLTISRSPIKDNDMINYFQFLLATQTEGIILELGKIKKADGTTLVDYDVNQTPNQRVTQAGRDFFMDTLGYRWASIAELSAAREAATPGTVNQWESTNQVKPRNLPGQVNEYGFDVGNHGTRAWWVVKESSISIPEFSSVSFDQDGSEDDQFGNRLVISENKLVIGQSNNNDDSLQFFETDANGQTITPLGVIKPTDNESGLYEGFGRQGDFKIEGNRLAVGTPNAYASDPNNQDQVNWDSWGTGAVYLFNLDGNSPSQVQRLQASDGTQDDYFGYSVDLDSNLLVVGAYGDDQDGLQNSGSAYVFKRGTNGQYAEIAKLLPEESQADAQFGHTVAVADQVIAIGAPNTDITIDGSKRYDIGIVLLFKEDGAGNLSITQEIQAPNSSDSDHIRFGDSISVDGSKLVVGAYGNHRTTSGNYLYEQGAAYLYLIQSDGTAQLAASIFSPNPREYGKFGSSVSIEEDRLLISAPYEDSDNGSQSGVVYVYKVTSDGKVTLQERLTHPTGKANDEFGRSIGLAGQNILVGAPGYDLSNDRWNGGGAVLFRSSQ